MRSSAWITALAAAAFLLAGCAAEAVDPTPTQTSASSSSSSQSARPTSTSTSSAPTTATTTSTTAGTTTSSSPPPPPAPVPRSFFASPDPSTDGCLDGTLVTSAQAASPTGAECWAMGLNPVFAQLPGEAELPPLEYRFNLTSAHGFATGSTVAGTAFVYATAPMRGEAVFALWSGGTQVWTQTLEVSSDEPDGVTELALSGATTAPITVGQELAWTILLSVPGPAQPSGDVPAEVGVYLLSGPDAPTGLVVGPKP